jgi:hypothetical protein
MYLISFLLIQKAESTSHPFERGKVTAYHHHINRSASYSSAKTVTARLDFAPNSSTTRAVAASHYNGAID